jgi:hypothetical protein
MGQCPNTMNKYRSNSRAKTYSPAGENATYGATPSAQNPAN